MRSLLSSLVLLVALLVPDVAAPRESPTATEAGLVTDRPVFLVDGEDSLLEVGHRAVDLQVFDGHLLETTMYLVE